MSATYEIGPEFENMELPRHLQPVPAEKLNESEQWSPLLLNTGIKPDLAELIEYMHDTHSSEYLIRKTMESTGLTHPEEREIEGLVEIKADEAEFCVSSIQKLRALPMDETQKIISRAAETYREEYFNENGRLNIDALVDLTDATDKYEDSSLLDTLLELRFNSKKDATEAITVEAERIARIMILQEQEQ